MLSNLPSSCRTTLFIWMTCLVLVSIWVCDQWCGMWSSLSRVQLFATPWTIAYHAPPSVGFSRQEYWGGLPFPSPGDLPNPGIEPGSPTLQADALPSEPPGKLKNTGVGCHVLLQGIFLTQGSNPGLPHCRQNLYCMSHQGRYLYQKNKYNF